MGTMAKREWAILITVHDEVEANIIKKVLEDHGVACDFEEHPASYDEEGPVVYSPTIDILVKKPQLKDAQRIINQNNELIKV